MLLVTLTCQQLQARGLGLSLQLIMPVLGGANAPGCLAGALQHLGETLGTLKWFMVLHC